ncbi:hypothetical protein [Leptothoe spongobia]|uniref:Uncharacterized protein n=1 Tax=Leptothoe spongobia TAU-MAC 1115 TaxID=1967444 RepID=A0A947DEJ5_9CYAN|nr:hypothetical protein [Leptothoe spongobia]MBT9315199.1 hypothetical protein [Leptothoe spongobia TAU-MAC 1115]
MPTDNPLTNESERPLVVWLIQGYLLFLCLGTLFSMGLSYQFCATPDLVESCWSQAFILQLLLSVIVLTIQLWLLYGLEKGLPYARWLIGILMIAVAVTNIDDMHYIQLIFRAMEPGKGLHTPPYDCWQPENLWNNVVIFCGYNSYAQLARKVLWELLILGLQIFPGVWLVASRSSRRYFASKVHQ